MDTAPLNSAYERLIELAAHADFTDPAPTDPAPTDAADAANDEWPADLVLAHVTVNDELLIEAVRAVLANKPTPHYDNAAAVDADNLRAQGSRPELIDRLRTSSRQLCDLADQLGPLEDTPVVVTIRDGDELRADGRTMPIGQVLQIHADVHLPSHVAQLEGLRSPSS